MEGYGLVRLERGERGRITPKVMHDRVELDLPLTLVAQGELSHDRLDASRPDRRQPVKAGAIAPPLRGLRP